jgi:hypothetical protein
MSALALSVAAAACAPRSAAAQEATPVPAEATPATAPADVRFRDQQRKVHDRVEQIRRQEHDLARANADIARVHADLARDKGFQFVSAFARTPLADGPAIVSTAALDTAAQAELREDLVVMDKLIRDEVAAVADGDEPSALGIKLTLTGRAAPQYVEGAGAVFSLAVGFPLAPVGAADAKAGDKPRDPASKWEQAKRELGAMGQPKRKGAPPEPLVFEQAKLDQLQGALVKLLPEASNFRHLKENESVFITVTGIDEGGAPVRLTMRAGKADIDAAAAGKVTPGEFAQRVARRIG